ncbi:putative spore germination protein GerPD [Paenibacillus konkukensis]|uniref:Spore germination protein GerPD n=1 Tax=Paenibacillus konkukensis TaxID=2020716 RepID=A0ABY4RLI0_9BACL|nr:hypothetical protein [Paenibacillus doosanensis]UQZ82162.1 putative spore germination protein GerPD [Paenibacillus konkukensis]
MKMTVNNKCIHVGNIKVGGVGSASVFLIGDAEVITSTSYFDTPADSLVYSPNIPLYPLNLNPARETELTKNSRKKEIMEE